MATFCLNYGSIGKHFARLAEFPLSQTYQSSGGSTDGLTVADLSVGDELVIFSSRKALTFRRKGLRCKVSLLIQEPREIQRGLYSLIPMFHTRYHRIFTHSDYVLKWCSNAEKWLHGGAWVDTTCGDDCEKTDLVSIIASNKRRAEGHKLRHEVIEWARAEAVDLDVFGRGYQSLEDKTEGHAPYYFSVVFENSRASGYFTEKIIDSILCKSVPIYWGDPNIAAHFDTKGMIVCQSFDDVIGAVQHADAAWYHENKAHILENRRRAIEILGDEKCMERISG